MKQNAVVVSATGVWSFGMAWQPQTLTHRARTRLDTTAPGQQCAWAWCGGLPAHVPQCLQPALTVVTAWPISEGARGSGKLCEWGDRVLGGWKEGLRPSQVCRKTAPWTCQCVSHPDACRTRCRELCVPCTGSGGDPEASPPLTDWELSLLPSRDLFLASRFFFLCRGRDSRIISSSSKVGSQCRRPFCGGTGH